MVNYRLGKSARDLKSQISLVGTVEAQQGGLISDLNGLGGERLQPVRTALWPSRQGFMGYIRNSPDPFTGVLASCGIKTAGIEMIPPKGAMSSASNLLPMEAKAPMTSYLFLNQNPVQLRPTRIGCRMQSTTALKISFVRR